MEPNDYDEFALFRENAAEAGLSWRGKPAVERRSVEVAPRQRVSTLVWGRADPELVLLHGGAQNAHTWDTVALALDRPLVAIDLPGHGRSDWRDDHDYGPRRNAEAVAVAVEKLAPRASLVVGMSLGGLTTLALATLRPGLVRRALLVDVTPGASAAKAEPIVAFVTGPESFASFDEILARTVAHNPTRSLSSLRRGVLHNAKRREDGRWVWRYDRLSRLRSAAASGDDLGLGVFWDDLERLRVPLLLVRGALSRVVDDADVAELRSRKPDAEVVMVAGAGHSVQGDRPVELARIIERFARPGTGSAARPQR
jgi:pimeloyl-ACP methyl ester carboxylesterase